MGPGIPVSPLLIHSGSTPVPHVTFGAKTFCRLAATCAIIGSSAVVIAASWTAAGHPRSADRDLNHGERAESTPLTLRNPRVVVLKSARTLHLFDGETLVRIYPIVLGPDPVGPKLRAADGRTPEGTFRICTNNADSPHHRFLGIDYPSRHDADRGLGEGLISQGEATAIHRAIEQGACPLWTTGLGGGIGLHGMTGVQGRTAGCIALADTHIDELFNVLRIADEVEILP